MSSIYLFCLKKATVFILEIFFNFDPNTGSFKTRKNEFNSTLGLINVTLVNGFPSNPFTSRLLYLICFVLIKDNRLETKAKENCSDLFSSRAVYCCWGNLLICFSFHNYNAARLEILSLCQTYKSLVRKSNLIAPNKDAHEKQQSTYFPYTGIPPLMLLMCGPKLYIPSTLNNSNRAYTFICLGRAGRFGQC